MAIPTVDNMKVEVPAGTSVLDACRQAGARVPTLCYLKGVQSIGACRVCLVEIEGARTFGCVLFQPAADGMVVKTSTPRVRRARKTVLELCSRSMTATARPAPVATTASSPVGARNGHLRDSLRGRENKKVIDVSTPALQRAAASASCAAVASPSATRSRAWAASSPRTVVSRP